MAEREEKSSTKTAEKPAAAKAPQQQKESEEESSGSEYEEIIEEVTDYSDAEEELHVRSPSDKSIKKSSSTKSNESNGKSTKKLTEESKKATKTDATDAKVKSSVDPKEKANENLKEKEKEKEKEKGGSEKKEKAGESLVPFLQNLLHKCGKPATQQPTNQQKTANQNSQKPTKDTSKAKYNISTNTTTQNSKQTQKTNTNRNFVVAGSVSAASVSNSSGNSNTESSKYNSANSSSKTTAISLSNNNKKISSSTNTKTSTTTKTATSTATTTNTTTRTPTPTSTSTSTPTPTNEDNMTNKPTTTTPTSGNETKLDRLKVPQREDSGIESGEDLRLIAAGLRDKLQMQNGDLGLIEEVTTALCKLEYSLKEGREIAVDGPKRKALLALVARLQTGLMSPEELEDERPSRQATTESMREHDEQNIHEASSPENETVRTSRHRFAKKRNRNIRHTVGVSREELDDARRYMEDKLIMESISNSVTPDSGITPTITPPHHAFPIAKNASSGAILTSQTPKHPLFRRNQLVSEDSKDSSEYLSAESSVVHRNFGGRNPINYRRPLSGEYSVDFEQQNQRGFISDGAERNIHNDDSPDSAAKELSLNNKRQLMKRANTIDLPKSRKYNAEFDTDSDLEDRGPNIGLKRTVQVSVKHKVRNVVPKFEPRTENDHKFLAFLNKQTPKPGLGWTPARSVSNWTNKFGNIKNTFEVGSAATSTSGKPPQVPGHYSSATNRKQNQFNSDYGQSSTNMNPPQWQMQQEQRLLQQQQQQQLQQQQEAFERQRRRLEREKMERERIELDRLERQHFERERVERDRLEREGLERERERLEREYFERERERVHRERLAAAAAAQQQQKQQQRQQRHQQASAPVNQFIHAPQSVFKPIENENFSAPNVFKPVPQMPVGRNAGNIWQPPSRVQNKPATNSPKFLSHNKYPYTNSPQPSNATSPVGLPWLAKSTVNSDFKKKANRFEEASLNDIREEAMAAAGVHGLFRHNSLRSGNVGQQQMDAFRKRPSLPNATDPYCYVQNPYAEPSPNDLPPPTNISFRYADCDPRATNFKSVPCLPTAVDDSTDGYMRPRRDSLTNPQATPLVLTNTNPSYGSRSENFPNTTRQFEYSRPNVDSTPTSPSVATFPHTDYTDDDLDLDSDQNLLEYRVDSRVMRKPQSQTAFRVGRNANHVSDDEVFGKNSHHGGGKHLLHTMRSLGNEPYRKPIIKKFSSTPTTPPHCFSPDGRSYQAPIVEPLFPEITNFTPNREPLYVGERAPKPMSRAQQFYQNTAYKRQQKVDQPSPPISFDQNRSYQATTAPLVPPPPAPLIPPPPAPPAPYASETRTSYVVTYPKDDHSDVEDQQYRPTKQPPKTLPLHRQRQVSENSEASSATSFNNLPSPNTSWTQNPVHLEEQEDKITVTKMSSTRTSETNQQVSMQQQRSPPREAPLPDESEKVGIQPSKPPTIVNTSYQGISQEPYHRTPKINTRSETIPATTTTTHSRREFNHHQKVFQQEQQPKAPFLRQKTIDTSTPSKGLTPMPKSTPPASQKSQVTKTNFEKFEESQERFIQQGSETRRSSLGQQQTQIVQEQQQRKTLSYEAQKSEVINEKQQQRKTISYEAEKSEVINQEVYKSSAPPDTPDIVKSSLPKDETMPILKKFGPPQRHCYLPNSYQSPALTKKLSTESTTKVIKRSEVVQHSLLTTKPSIVETPATPQPQDANNNTKNEDMIPRNIVFNNVSAFTSLSRQNTEPERSTEHVRFNVLAKSDSWNQICRMQQSQPPTITSPKFNLGSGSELRRTKSGHTLAVPKMYEAGMNKEESSEKQRTVAAYFSGKKSPTTTTTTSSSEAATEVVVTRKSSINRTKTTEKVSSANRKSLTSSNGSTTFNVVTSGGLARSATMPSIVKLKLLDESNVDDAFEQLMSAQQSLQQQREQHGTSSTSEKTETKEKDGATVTTTTKVTTRTVTAGNASKQISPFNKFKQLDRQNSLPSQKCSSTPSTPNTPGSGSIFKFTDPSLNAKAATMKDQLLQWCQLKTKDYENVQISNFSSSWSDGLAFCALIHHFLPDAFDYSKLTPQSRRHNFELAFRVADEKAGIAPLLDVEDMVIMKRPDWKSVFVYVQSIYRRFRNCQ